MGAGGSKGLDHSYLHSWEASCGRRRRLVNR
jgi:hypothetical protein